MIGAARVLCRNRTLFLCWIKIVDSRNRARFLVFMYISQWGSRFHVPALFVHFDGSGMTSLAPARDLEKIMLRVPLYKLRAQAHPKTPRSERSVATGVFIPTACERNRRGAHLQHHHVDRRTGNAKQQGGHESMRPGDHRMYVRMPLPFATTHHAGSSPGPTSAKETDDLSKHMVFAC